MILLFTVYIGTVVMKELAGRTSASLPHPLWFGVWSLSQERPQQKWREYTSHSVTHTKQTHHHTRTHIHTHTTQTHHHTPTLTHTKQRRAYSLMHARAHTHTLHKHTTTHTHTFGLTLTFVVARSTKYCNSRVLSILLNQQKVENSTKLCCLDKSPFLWKIRPHTHTEKIPDLKNISSTSLFCARMSTAPEHNSDHCLRSWHNWNHPSPTPIARSCYLIIPSLLNSMEWPPLQQS